MKKIAIATISILGAAALAAFLADHFGLLDN